VLNEQGAGLLELTVGCRDIGDRVGDEACGQCRRLLQRGKCCNESGSSCDVTEALEQDMVY
jgi:hypothetical protein